MALVDGETQIIRRIFPGPRRESLRIRVSFESRKGMWLREWDVRA